MILTVFRTFDPFAHRVSALRGSLQASWKAPSMLLESPLHPSCTPLYTAVPMHHGCASVA